MTQETINWLVSQGRDPLEILLIPPDKEIRERLEVEYLKRLDAKIVHEIQLWPKEWRDRLGQWIDQQVKQAVDLSQAGSK